MREDASPLHTMSVEEYLEFDESSQIRHEYVAGEVYAMPDSTVRHSTIVGNIGFRLHALTGDGSCKGFMSAMRLQVRDDIYYYPDVMVVCTPLDDLDKIVRDPCVVVEVTLPSTARIDRVEKLTAYRRFDSLLAYVIVDHERRRVERYWRNAPRGEWNREDIVTRGRVPVPCLDVELTLDEVYRRVELPAVGEAEADESPDYESEYEV